MSKNLGGVQWASEAGTRQQWYPAAVAGNVAHNFTCPAGCRIKILYGRVTVVADANAAARKIYVYIQDSTNVVEWISRSSTTINLGETKSVSYGVSDLAGQATDLDNLALPKEPILEAGDILTVSLNGGLAGDTYRPCFVYLQMARGT